MCSPLSRPVVQPAVSPWKIHVFHLETRLPSPLAFRLVLSLMRSPPARPDVQVQQCRAYIEIGILKIGIY